MDAPTAAVVSVNGKMGVEERKAQKSYWEEEPHRRGHDAGLPRRRSQQGGAPRGATRFDVTRNLEKFCELNKASAALSICSAVSHKGHVCGNKGGCFFFFG
ncbi:uncharacterized protein LOC8073941 [Sorghum bicolor]|uniref:uncharacterized protein LOC8073941 n=1 Tax=Sorghum bicolor TaxID=4558 RepID=UPI000B424543|nr:uncharacterized protein LOC8073941 [Sorghum bicolor]|eukprot:XP_021315057.1 uncharacterized protein LOC8073941 [Sorghum bicolor]